MSLSSKLFISIILLAAGGGFYATPYLAAKEIKAAADAQDAVKLNNYVNFPVLKENLKASFNKKMSTEMEKESGAGAIAGAALAGTFVNSMVDALITPENLTRLIKYNKTALPKTKKSENDSSAEDVNLTMGYKDFDHFSVVVTPKKNSNKSLELIFQRENVISWKLAALTLPF